MKEINQVKEILNNFYINHSTYKNKRNDIFKCNSVYNNEIGLGDSFILTSVLPYIKVNNKLLFDIDGQYIDKNNLTNDVDTCITELAGNDWGGGHCIQRFQKSLGLNVDIKPKGFVKYDETKKIKNKVFVHLENNTDWKRGIPNSLSNKDKEIVSRFFNENINYIPFYYNNNLTLNELISHMETCEYFLGIDSGPMHVAASMDLKSIINVNDPNNLIYLPKIKECELPNSEWLYPQNVHLNRSGETELVPKFTYENLLSAFKGEVYPYWKDDFLDVKYE